MTYHNTRPGDLGRRVATRRQALGQTREQAAARAEMATSYLAYIEENPVVVRQECLMRLADALETTAEALLGAEPAPSSADLAGRRGVGV
jgi:transcriptional regulator with XRE-family HTH domain